MKNVVTVLDFSTAEVFIYHYEETDIAKNYSDDIEEFISSKGHNVNDCQYMCADELKLTVQ